MPKQQIKFLTDTQINPGGVDADKKPNPLIEVKAGETYEMDLKDVSQFVGAHEAETVGDEIPDDPNATPPGPTPAERFKKVGDAPAPSPAT